MKYGDVGKYREYIEDFTLDMESANCDMREILNNDGRYSEAEIQFVRECDGDLEMWLEKFPLSPETVAYLSSLRQERIP